MDQSIPIESLIGSSAAFSRRVDQSLASDARGYFCPGCKTKFYPEYDVTADVCLHYKSNDFRKVVSFVCSIGPGKLRT